MIKTLKFNNLTEEMMPKIERGKTISFRLLSIGIDASGKPLIPTVLVPQKDVIYDKFAQKYVDIALVSRVGAGDNGEEFADLWFQPNTGGIMTLSGDSAVDVGFAQYMLLSNHRADNTDRDPSRVAIYELVAPEAKAEKFLESFAEKQKATNFALDCAIGILRDMATSKGVYNTDWDDNQLREWAVKIAEKAPGEFLKVSVAQDKVVSAYITSAINKGIILYDGSAGVFKWAESKEPILTVYRAVPNRNEKLAAYALENKEFFKTIKSIIDG